MATQEKLHMIDVPMPIRTQRLLIRPKQAGDGSISVAAVTETWHDLHQWMAWAEDLSDFTTEQQEVRIRDQLARFHSRQDLNLLGIETATGQPVVWCGLHDIDWNVGECNIGFWVRRNAQGQGFATESTNALLRYAFGALGMCRIGITHSECNTASRRIVEKLGFSPEAIHPAANRLPGGRFADRWCYSRRDLFGLPPLDVTWA